METRQQFEGLNPTTREVRQWLDYGLCPFCGSKCPSGQCYARKCAACTSIWKSETLADVHDGYRLTEEQCPECDRCLYWSCDNPAPTFAPADWFEVTCTTRDLSQPQPYLFCSIHNQTLVQCREAA